MHEPDPIWCCTAFGAALVFFFNAAYFKKRVLQMAASHAGAKWFIMDGSPINAIDSTGAAMWEDLRALGTRLGFANLRTEVRALLERSAVQAALGEGAIFPTLKSAVDACNPDAYVETPEVGTERLRKMYSVDSSSCSQQKLTNIFEIFYHARSLSS